MDGAGDAVPDPPLCLEVRPEGDDRAGQVAASDGPWRGMLRDVLPIGRVLTSAERLLSAAPAVCEQEAGDGGGKCGLTCAANATLIRTSLSPSVGVGISLTEPLWPYLSAATSSWPSRSVGASR